MQCKCYQRHQQTVFILASCKADRMIIIRSHGIRALNATVKCALQSMVACEKKTKQHNFKRYHIVKQLNAGRANYQNVIP